MLYVLQCGDCGWPLVDTDDLAGPVLGLARHMAAVHGGTLSERWAPPNVWLLGEPAAPGIGERKGATTRTRPMELLARSADGAWQLTAYLPDDLRAGEVLLLLGPTPGSLTPAEATGSGYQAPIARGDLIRFAENVLANLPPPID